MELFLRRSGGQLDFTNLAKESGVSRPTAISYLDAMEVSNVACRIRPFHGGSSREIVRQPKAYGFDTGLISWVNGWDTIRAGDRGLLWEHLVLDELRARFDDRQVHYWRDKSGREVDFVIDRGERTVDTVEAKISVDRFETKNLHAFREIYPAGNNYLVVPYADRPYRVRRKEIVLTVCEPSAIPGQ